MAGGLDGCPLNIEGASQLMHEEGESRTSMTPVTHRWALGCTSMPESRTGRLRPGCRTEQKRALVGSEERQPVTQPPATPNWESQVNPARSTDNSERHPDQKLRAHTCCGGPRCQTTMVCIRAGKRMWRLQRERALQLPYTWCTSRQSGRD